MALRTKKRETQQTVKKKIVRTAFRSARNTKRHQKTTPGKVLNFIEAR